MNLKFYLGVGKVILERFLFRLRIYICVYLFISVCVNLCEKYGCNFYFIF